MVIKKTIQILLFCVVGAVFYYSWLPDPSLSSESYIPKWLLNWSNYYYNLRTAIPFVAFGFLLEEYSDFNTRNRSIKNTIIIYLRNLAISATIVCIAEGGQFLIKNRNPDLMDVFFGILGSIVGGLGYHLINVLIYFKKIRNAK
ncbi:hypothetical protein [Flavobacterium cellulosilyticum]|uniref:VanZ-like domain-containing protein n=1 Tax=Flavobacterium cellulosilyticum TaxID=2541731 RepID=A0A4R5C4Q8_9FLAO|nr:hypothetical protein [Flavobacterium cellulosilyticum]TDD94691.1 hypothetical protein E0F76_15745 [Flavobacterium cellulosilyticum]